MIITSKYNIKDKIFWLENNKIRTAIVKAIQFPLIQTLKDKTILKGGCMYFVSANTKSSVINWNGGGLKENEVFGNKKDLLKSL